MLYRALVHVNGYQSAKFQVPVSISFGAMSPPVQTCRKHNVFLPVRRPSVRPSIRSSVTNLVNMIFRKRVNQFRCNLAQIVSGTTALIDQLWGSGGQTSRSIDMIKVLKLTQNQLCGCHSNSSDLTHRTMNLWADFEQRVIDRAINEWENTCGPVSRPKDCYSNTCCNF